MLPIGLYGLFVLGMGLFLTWTPGWFGDKPAAPPQEFLGRFLGSFHLFVD